MKAFIFTGQGSQFPGMGKDLFDKSDLAKEFFETGDKFLGFKMSELMFEGELEELKKTSNAQPAIFLHSVIKAKTTRDFKPDMVAGHSLGELSALVSSRCISFGEGLKLVRKRGELMQEACEQTPSTMAAVLGLDDDVVEKICSEIDEIVVPANYNSPGQLVISGTLKGVEIANEKLLEAGARKCITLKVAGAFHSPIMEKAQAAFKKVVDEIKFKTPICPIYQNATSLPHTDPSDIRKNLIDQITHPVLWSNIINNMIEEGARDFYEVGPKPVLSSLVKKISGRANAHQL